MALFHAGFHCFNEKLVYTVFPQLNGTLKQMVYDKVFKFEVAILCSSSIKLSRISVPWL